MLSLRVLGGFELHRGDAVQALPPSKKTRALLAYLALTGRRHRRDRLCRLFWDLPDDPRGSLRWSLTKLRPLVNDGDRERILADREYVSFDPAGAEVDLLEIRRALTGGAQALSTERLTELAGRFQGELLEGLSLPEHGEFEAWLLAERDAAQRTRATVLAELVARLGERPAEAVPFARDWIRADPFSVEAHASLLRYLRAAGRTEELAHQFEASLGEVSGEDPSALGRLEDAARGPARGAGPTSTPGKATPPGARQGLAPGHEPILRQEIRFATASDGVRIAYASVGQGPPLLKTANWLNHLEFDWDSPIWKHVFRGLARDRRLIRYDARGNGLSDWDVEEVSFEAYVRDLESVVEAAGVEEFPLLGISQGCAISVEYAVRHPERVTRLVLHGGYATGWRVGADAAEIARREALQTLILHGWREDNPAFRQVFTSAFIPDGTPEQFRWMNELQRISISPDNAVRLQQALATVDIRDRLPLVQVPVLVLHSREDGRIPYRKGVELAQGIPNARLVTLESRNHLLLEHEPEFPRFLDEIRSFLAEDRAESGRVL